MPAIHKNVGKHPAVEKTICRSIKKLYLKKFLLKNFSRIRGGGVRGDEEKPLKPFYIKSFALPLCAALHN